MKRILIFLVLASGAFGATGPMNTWREFYTQTTGSNLNSGSTNTDAATYTSTNGSWNSGTGVFTPTSGNPSLTVAVGDYMSVFVDAATVTGFISRVTAVNSTTISGSNSFKSGTAPTTAATGMTCKVGGAWKGPNGTEAFPFGFVDSAMKDVNANFPRFNFKAGTYNITAAMTHTASLYTFQGYTTTPGDGGKAIIDGGTSGASYALLTMASSGNGQSEIADFTFQNNGATGSAVGLQVNNGRSTIFRCLANNIRGEGMVGNGTVNIIESEAYACNQSNTANLGGIAQTTTGIVLRCISHDNVGSNANGFRVAREVPFVNCIADTNGGKGFYVSSAQICILVGCDAYNNTGDGIDFATAGASIYVENCNLVKNGGYGINSSGTAQRDGWIRNCAFGSGSQVNTSGQVLATMYDGQQLGTVTYASGVTPWVDPANGDFRINLAVAKGAGIGAFPAANGYTAGVPVGYPDIGASQHRDTGTAVTFAQ